MRHIPPNAYKVADSQVASRWGNILEFQEFDLITPNEREVRFALGDQDSVVRPLAQELYKKAKCKMLILKLGDRGNIVYRSNNGTAEDFFTVDSFADRVIDAVGSGDAMLAYATLGMLATKSPAIAVILGAFAAGLAVEHEGNNPVRPDQIMKKIAAVEDEARYS